MLVEFTMITHVKFDIIAVQLKIYQRRVEQSQLWRQKDGI